DAAGTITAGNWNNIVMIYDAANSLYRFALNGTLMDFQVNSTDKTVDWTQTTNLTMGVAPGGSSDRTDANTGLDEFKIYGVNNGEDLATLVQNEYANGNANIPEPATATLSALGLLSLLTLRRRH
ncbi:MAG: LamG-like jellyroll fold domain-containing protein, partial [Akkermansia sp.]